MKKRIKRIISMFAIAVAMLSMLSVNVMAAGTELEGANERYTPVDTYRYNYGGHNFKQINLEDASCLDAAVAKKIRAILLNSYPNVAVETIGQQTGIADLTVEEIVSATKIALSQYQSPENFDIHYTYDESISTQVDDYIACWYMELSEDEPDSEAQAEEMQEEGENSDEEETPDDNANIKAIKERLGIVINYFLGLERVQVNPHFVSTASFVDYSQAPIFTKNEDNTYNVEVKVTVSVVKQETDTMTLRAVMGDGTYYTQAELEDGENIVSLVLNNIPAELAYTEIKLAIDGVQTANADAFMFVSKDSEEMPKPFIAMGSGQVPVHAEVTLIPPMEICLTKSAMIREKGAEGQVTEKEAYLEGITFDIYRLENETLIATITTDAAGSAYCNLTALGQQPGEFLVVERSHPALCPTDPVKVTLPYAADNGNVYREELFFEDSFKNIIKGEIYETPQVRADVTRIENNLDSFEARSVHTWIVRGDIPVDIAVGKEYVITDTLDYRLSYAGDESVVVKVGPRNGETGTEAVTLTRDVDYTLISTPGETTVDDAGSVEAITSLQIRLTDVGKRMVAGAVANGVFSDYEVRVYFNAYIDEDASAGEMIPNQAILEYINYVNYYLYTVPTHIPKVYTCGIMVYIHDAANENAPLNGAEFKLARLATQAEIDAGLSKPLVINGETAYVVYISFYTKSEMTQEEYWADKALSVTSDAAGFATLYGIADGEYYLIETKAHAGYNLPSEPIQISVNDQTPYLVKYVANSSNLEFPPTGGIGTTIFMVGGAILIGAAIVILILNRKKEDAEEDEEE